MQGEGRIKRGFASGRFFRRGVAVFCAALLLPALLLSAPSCVIAQAPAEPQQIRPFRPTILHGAVFPPTNRLLSRFPDKFVIPVELVNPSATFEWRAYIDYDPVTGDPPVEVGTSSFDPASSDGGVRSIEVAITPPADLATCHVVEFLVANSFLGAIEGRPAHTPDAIGGDSVIWFYAPGGDTRSCPSFSQDAGVDGALE